MDPVIGDTHIEPRIPSPYDMTMIRSGLSSCCILQQCLYLQIKSLSVPKLSLLYCFMQLFPLDHCLAGQYKGNNSSEYVERGHTIKGGMVKVCIFRFSVCCKIHIWNFWFNFSPFIHFNCSEKLRRRKMSNCVAIFVSKTCVWGSEMPLLIDQHWMKNSHGRLFDQKSTRKVLDIFANSSELKISLSNIKTIKNKLNNCETLESIIDRNA